MEEKINSAPRAALNQIGEVRHARKSVKNLRFFCCCCVPDDELETMNSEGTTSLKRLIRELNKLVIPEKDYSDLNTALSRTVTVQTIKTRKIIEDSINPEKYPGLTADYISALSKLLRSLPTHEEHVLNDGNESEDSHDSRSEFN